MKKNMTATRSLATLYRAVSRRRLSGFDTAPEHCRILINDLPLLHARIARTGLSRLRGLLGFPALERNCALVLHPCSAVHSMGLTYPIDVVFLNRKGSVVKCALLKPRSFVMCWQARSVVEMASGTVNRLGIKAGDRLISEEAMP